MSIRTALMEMAKPKTERASWVPEAILDDDVADFMGAAAAAKKAGKKEFEFGGKKYKVTMKDKTADAISEATFATDIDYNEEDDIKKVAKRFGVKVGFVNIGGATEMQMTGDKSKIMKAVKALGFTDQEIKNAYFEESAECPTCRDGECQCEQPVKEEMDPTDHVSKKGDMYCVYNKDGEEVAKFDNEEEANAYAIKNHDALMGKEEMDEAAAPGSTAQHGPDDATRDTYEKQMGAGENSVPMSKKEDIVNQHTAEVALDAEAIYKQNQEEAEKAVKQGAGRLGDQRKGDTSFVNPIKSEIIDGITKALQQMKTNS